MIPFLCLPIAFPAAALVQGQETVLVVEDEAILCELAAEALTDEGYRVLTAADADAAEQMLVDEHVDLLFTDIDLDNRTNGLALARSARRLLPDLPVVYTSGGRKNLSAGEAVPASVFMPKPYRLHQLVAVTGDLLRAQRSQHA